MLTGVVLPPEPDPRPAGLLSSPRFVVVVVGEGLSMLGDAAFDIALAWMVLHTTGSVGALAAVMLAHAIPRGLLLLLGGAVTDRVSARRVMTAAHAVRCVAMTALAALLLTGGLELWHLIQILPVMTVNDAVLGVLALIDLSLAANLLLIVIFSGYENFVSRMDLHDHEDRPNWQGEVDFSGLKLKLVASIVAISGIHLLKRFMEIGEADAETPFDPLQLRWMVVIHLTFVISGVLQGIGMGLVFVPHSTTAFATMAVDLRADATALFSLVRNIGSSIGISVVGFLLTRNIQVNHTELVSGLTITSPELLRQRPVLDALPGGVPWNVLDGLVTQQALMISYLDDFVVMMWLCLAVLPLTMILRRPGVPAGPAAHHME